MAYLLYGEAYESLRGFDQVKRLRFHGYMAYLLYGEAYESLRGFDQVKRLRFLGYMAYLCMEKHMSL